MVWKTFGIVFFLLSIANLTYGQSDTITQKKLGDKLSETPVVTADTITQPTVKDSIVRNHSPKKATIYSAILPGLGQAYNRKYWKIPVIYGIGGLLTYFVIDNNKQYIQYKNAFKIRMDGNPATVDPYINIYTDDDLKVLKDYYRRNRDLSYIGIGATYILNIVDAAVDAHLFYFDISDDLTLKAEPSFSPLRNMAFAGVRLTLQLK